MNKATENINTNFDNFYKFSSNILNKYKESNCGQSNTFFLTLLHKATISIKTYIDNPDEKGVSWDKPFVELHYPINLVWDKLNSTIRSLTDEDLKDRRKRKKAFCDLFLKPKDLHIFALLSDYTVFVLEDNRYTFLLPWGKQKEKDKIEPKPYEGYKSGQETFSISITGHLTDAKRREGEFKADLFCKFGSLIIDKKAQQAYYPVLSGLIFSKGCKPKEWSKEEREIFWDILLRDIKKAIPKDDLKPLPEPTVISIRQKNALVKASLHTELQKFGKKSQNPLFTLFDQLDENTKKEATKYKIEVIGIDNTQAQNKALFTIQKLLHNALQKDRLEGTQLDGHNSFLSRSFLPSLKFTPTQYLDVYGVGKRETLREKWEFNANVLRLTLFGLKMGYFVSN